MKKRRILFSVLAIAFGIFLIVFGGYDDSPGGQMIGLLAVIFGIVTIIKGGKKRSR